jgi:diguanylate cyclase (GGDEF)-like protein
VRYGGEEFLLAMSGAERAAAEAVAERLRSAIAAHDWARLAAGLEVTTSIGLADGAEVLDAAALLTLADRRLYAAKYGGRNRTVVRD